MGMYRSKMDPLVPEPLTSTSGPRRTALGYVNHGLPSDFNVVDDDDMSWSEASIEIPPVDQEYKAYVRGARLTMDIDLVNFWEVSFDACHFYLVLFH